MKIFYVLNACFFGFFTTVYAAEPLSVCCLEKENALVVLEMAENLLNRAKQSAPNCNDEKPTDESECGRNKHLAYMEISKKMISDVRKNFKTCSKPVDKDEVIDEVIIEDKKFRYCSEIYSSGRSESGVYTIWLGENITTAKPLEVYCDMDAGQGGWTVIQRRGKYPVQQDFYLDWKSYQNFFGKLTEEFWLGNDNIYALCNKGCELRIDLQDEKGEKGYAVYENFSTHGPKYTLSISGFSGNVGDSMSVLNKINFGTKDYGDTLRSIKYRCGWWQIGYHANLNGIYKPGVKNDIQTVGWRTWRQMDNLASVEMKVRPK